MNKIVYIFMCIGISFLSFGQKKGINYQAVILDPNPLDIPGNQITGQPFQKGKVAIKFTISSIKGVDYTEIQQTETDEFGLINLTIGLAPTNGSLSSNSSSETGAKYSTFDAIVWDEYIKNLAVSVSFNNGKTFTEVSNQKLSYTAYALYAESVDYKNVRDAPTKLSQFSNDPGYLISKDLEPIKADIQSHTSQIKITNQTIDENKKSNDAAFLIVNQNITSLDTKLIENSTAIKDNTISISTIVTKLSEQQNQIAATNNNLNSQIGGLQGQIRETNDNVNNLSGTAEVVSNKSTAVDLGGSNPSDQLYPSQKATKTYVDQNISSLVAGNIPDATTLAPGKIQLAGDLSGTAQNPTVPALANKENTSNKSTNVQDDAGSDSKYPSVKAVKTYVDQATMGTALQATVDGKADKNSPSFTGTPMLPTGTTGVTQSPADNSTKLATTAFVQAATAGIALQAAVDAKADKNSPTFTGTPVLPSSTIAVTQSSGDNSTNIATTAFVQLATAGGVIDASTSAKGKLKLAGDLAGTAELPTVPGLALKANATDVTNSLALKEDAANKSTATDLGSTGASDVLFPSQKAVKTYVDTQVATKSIVDADASTKGKIQLAGDLAGTAASPTVPGLALKAPIESPTFTGTVSGITKTMIGLSNVDNTSDEDKPISSATATALSEKAVASEVTSSLALKAPLNSPTFTGTPSLPTGTTASTQTSTDNSTKLATTAFVQLATAGGVIDASASAKGKLKLAGDLAGTADLPTVPGLALKANSASLALKEDASNKSNAALGSSTTLFPTQGAVKTYVDAQNTDASSSNKGKIQLTGDLTGSASSPAIASGAINSAKILDGSIATVDLADAAVTDAKIAAVAGSKVTGNITGNAGNVSGTVAVANGGTGATTLASNQVLLGNGTNAIQTVAPGTSGNVLMSNGTTWVSSSNTSDNTTHTIGESYGGGIIFYVYDGGKHGLIAATSDQSSNASWDLSSGNETRAKANGIGAGIKNTTLIISSEISQRKSSYDNSHWSYNGEDFAAVICNEYSKSETVNSLETTYGDWYLPSKYELNLLYLKRSVVGNFAADKYWSSTEYDADKAWTINFSIKSGSAETTLNKTDNYRVRAIRNF